MRKHNKTRETAGASQRQLRVGELVRHKLAELLSRGEVQDDVLASHLVTVPEVRMSPDLRHATVYVVSLGGADIEPVLAALTRHRRFIRGEVAHAVSNLKYAPELHFRKDESFEEASRIDQILASERVRRDIDKD